MLRAPAPGWPRHSVGPSTAAGTPATCGENASVSTLSIQQQSETPAMKWCGRTTAPALASATRSAAAQRPPSSAAAAAAAAAACRVPHRQALRDRTEAGSCYVTTDGRAGRGCASTCSRAPAAAPGTWRLLDLARAAPGSGASPSSSPAPCFYTKYKKSGILHNATSAPRARAALAHATSR